ncbi:N-6 DNA methylase [Nocardia sp. NPDC019304]|uniref:N-6 DNA methylase n=1 Tax=unclassified Nocardia TaxID=2637762 RepID=UPI0033FFEB42
MNDPMFATSLISRSELAELAGVNSATFKIWENRHPDFPGPVATDDRGRQYYDLARMLEWLDRRSIPSGPREGEHEGFTYGMRVRRELAARQRRRLAEIEEPDDPQKLSIVVCDLLELLRRWGRGSSSSNTDRITAAMCMIFLRVCDPEAWEELKRLAQTPSTQPQVLTRLGRYLDAAVRRYGIAVNMSPILGALRPQPSVEVKRLFEIIQVLGPRAVAYLVQRYDAEAELGSTEYFTPPAVVDLMVGAVVDPTADSAILYDPHIRGGELLRSAAGRYQPGCLITAHGSSPKPDLLRLAGLSLATVGTAATLRAGTSAPWITDDSAVHLADAVITNPPFNLKSEYGDDNISIAWPFGDPPPHNDNYAWLQHAISKLRPTGRAAVLMPARAGLSSNRSEREIRQRMVETGAVRAIIALPDKLFRGTDLAATIWVLQHPKGSATSIMFIDARLAGVAASGGRNRLPQEMVAIVVEQLDAADALPPGPTRTLTPNCHAMVVTPQGIRRAEYALDPSSYRQSSERRHQGELFRMAKEARTAAHASAEVAERAAKRVDRIELRPWLPSEWQVRRLEDVCDIQPGPSPSHVRKEHRTAEGVPIILNKHLRDRRIVLDEFDCLRPDQMRQMDRFILHADDIVVIRTGAVGDPVIVTQEHAGSLLGPNLIRLRVRETDLDPHYLLSYLSRPGILQWMAGRSSGSVVYSITAKTLGELEMTIPPIAEQQATGSALSAYDEQIVAYHHAFEAAKKARAAVAEGLIAGEIGVREQPEGSR